MCEHEELADSEILVLAEQGEEAHERHEYGSHSELAFRCTPGNQLTMLAD
jgi:hypothetical protein